MQQKWKFGDSVKIHGFTGYYINTDKLGIVHVLVPMLYEWEHHSALKKNVESTAFPITPNLVQLREEAQFFNLSPETDTRVHEE